MDSGLESTIKPKKRKPETYRTPEELEQIKKESEISGAGGEGKMMPSEEPSILEKMLKRKSKGNK